MTLDKVRAPRPRTVAPVRRVEVCGVQGMKSKPWRRRFSSEAAYCRWLDSEAAGSVTVHAYRDLEEGGMSALNLLPQHVQAAIARQDHSLRVDLAIIPTAEAAGWQVSFLQGWHSPAVFERDGITVWRAGVGWQRAELKEGHYCLHKRFPGDIFGLQPALGLEGAE